MSYFKKNEVNRILALPIGAREDKFIWAYTNHGAYTVKSRYWMIANEESVMHNVRSVQEQQVLELKRRVWKLATLPKIRMFLWRALSGALAVADRLQSRGLNVQSLCPMCHDN